MDIKEVKEFIEKYKNHCDKTYENLSSDKGCLDCELYEICWNLQRIDKKVNELKL